MNRPFRHSRHFRVVPSLLAISWLASCGGGSSSPAAITPKDPVGSVFEGRVLLESSAAPLRLRVPAEIEDSEPNSCAFDAQDMGSLNPTRTLGGEVGKDGDRHDMFRTGALAAGTVKITAHAPGASVVALRLQGGRSPAIPVYRGAGGEFSVAVAAGDQLVLGFSASQKTIYQAELRWSQGSVTLADAALANALDHSTVTAARLAWLPETARCVAGELLVVLKSSRADEDLSKLSALGLHAVEHGGGLYRMQVSYGPGLAYGDRGREALADLIFAARRAIPGLKVSPHYRQSYHAEPNDPHLKSGAQWGPALCNVPAAWDIAKGDGIVVGIVDSGILKDHPDLKAKISPDSYDFRGMDDDPEETDEEGRKSDWHGSHVAGIAAGATDNGEGIAGIAWKSMILMAKGNDDVMTTSQGILYASGLDNSSKKKPKISARVINMSFGGPQPDVGRKAVIEQALKAGKILVASAGNTGDIGNEPEWPAAYDGVIAVGAVGPDGQRAPYSNTGFYVDIVAPGGNSNLPNGGSLSASKVTKNGALTYGYQAFDGTSQASPFIAGTVALMLSADPTLKYEQIMAILEVTATDKGAPGRDPEYGVGLVNVGEAVKLAKSGLFLATDRPSIQLFSKDLTSTFSVQLTNGGRSGTAVTGLLSTVTTSPTPWLKATLSHQSTPAVVKIEIDRAKLALGTSYQGAVKIASANGGSITIPVMLRTQLPAPKALIRVILADSEGEIIKAENGKPKYEAVADKDGKFRMPGIPKGTYLVLAGVDEGENSSFRDPGDWSTFDGVVFGDNPTKISADGSSSINKDMQALFVFHRDIGKF